jgi:hypothetical protein
LKAPRFLHVANGSATTDLIEAAGMPGRVSIWADPLYEGPVPGGLSDLEVLRERAGYLSGHGAASQADVLKGLQGWRDEIEDVASYDELVLWYEHDLFDQLNLIQLLSWMTSWLPAATTVSLVEIGSFPGRPAFKGLGELTPSDISSLLDMRQPVSSERYELAVRAWAAFRQPTPEAVDALRQQDNIAMPFLSAALKRFLQEYPWTSDGLSRCERRLLAIAASGPVDLWTAFLQMHEGETAYYITDLSWLGMLREFSRCTPPLISVADIPLDADRIPHGKLAISDDGRAILNRAADRVAVYGIDRWFGGVHLTDRDGEWRWDEQADRMTRYLTRT